MLTELLWWASPLLVIPAGYTLRNMAKTNDDANFLFWMSITTLPIFMIFMNPQLRTVLFTYLIMTPLTADYLHKNPQLKLYTWLSYACCMVLWLTLIIGKRALMM